ncbi:MAG: hypothetical protein V4616_00400 [Bacteroidota bacterium]
MSSLTKLCGLVVVVGMIGVSTQCSNSNAVAQGNGVTKDAVAKADSTKSTKTNVNSLAPASGKLNTMPTATE